MEIERLRLQYEITRAQLLYEVTPAKLNISVEREADADPPKRAIDDQGTFDSVGIRSGAGGGRAQGEKAAPDAAGRYARETGAAPGGAAPSETAAPAPVERPGEVEIQAERSEVCVDWQPRRIDFTYIPYSVEFYIEKW